MEKIQLMQKMAKENPGTIELLYLLGLEYKEAGMAQEAIAAFSEALKSAQGELFEKIMAELSDINKKKKGVTVPANFAAEEEGPLPLQEPSPSEGPGRSGGYSTSEDPEPSPSEEHARSEAFAPSEENPQSAGPEDFGSSSGQLRLVRGGKEKQKPGAASAQKDNFQEITFADVGGLDDVKQAIKMKIIKPFLTPGLFEKFKKKSGGGLLFFGPPGCGKTFIARATAGECKAHFKPVRITDILDPYFGQSEQNISAIFSVARAQKPCILFFDEIDSIGFNRAKTSTDMMRSVVDQLLSEIDGIDSNTEKILIIGATNMPWDVDPALRRPGRFDKTIFVPPPDQNAREVIFNLKMAGKPCDEQIDYSVLAQESELFSGADIENVIDLATENVLEEILTTGVERNITQEDLLVALKSTKPSTIEWLRTISNYVKYANQSGFYDEVRNYLTRHKKYL
jgi:AAA+ superfamily predicted ATPase